jgi:hypothetical protein
MSEIEQDGQSILTKKKIASDEEKIAANWYDARLNGSVSAVLVIAISVFSILRLYEPIKIYNISTITLQILWKWGLLTLAYFSLGYLGRFYYNRAIAYSAMENLLGKNIGIGTDTVGKILKDKINEGTTSDHIEQRNSLWAIETRKLLYRITVLIFFTAWFAVAFQISN